MNYKQSYSQSKFDYLNLRSNYPLSNMIMGGGIPYSEYYDRFKDDTIKMYRRMLKLELDQKSESEISSHIKKEYLEYLNDLDDKLDIDLIKFAEELSKLKETMSIKNEDINEELRRVLPSRYHDRITDLNSAMMGVPAIIDSDLDFTIAIKDKAEQQEVRQILEENNYKLSAEYDENIEVPLKWLSFEKYVDGTEIEVKVRHIDAVNAVMVAHRGIRDDLTPKQKIWVSFIKSTLAQKKGQYVLIYKAFKYLLYTAMFDGDKLTFVFRHSDEKNKILFAL